MAKPELESAIADLGIVITDVFVPFSRSRNAGEGSPSLNWKVSVARNGRTLLSAVDYSAGMAHCPAYNDPKWGSRGSLDRSNAIRKEVEHGVSANAFGHFGIYRGAQVIHPDYVDVLWSLLQDASVLDSPTFEDWASDLGYDRDSRKAEAIYRECLRVALALRNGFTADEWQRLQDAAQDY